MKIRKCTCCGRYTLEESCPDDGCDASPPEPAPFSPEDRYGKYRRELKRQNFED